MRLQAKQHHTWPENHKKLGEAGRMLPHGLWRVCSPADTSTLDVQPPGAGEQEMGGWLRPGWVGQINVSREEADEGVEDICQGVIIMTDHGSKLGEGAGKKGEASMEYRSWQSCLNRNTELERKEVRVGEYGA